jgi:hypothetical protein
MSTFLQPTADSAALVGRNISPSPAPTAASFNPGDDSADIAPAKTPASPGNVDFITREVTRDTPATPGISKMISKSTAARKRSTKGANYYGEVFAIRDQDPAIPQSAGVHVQLKTNVIVSRTAPFASFLRLGLEFSHAAHACGDVTRFSRTHNQLGSNGTRVRSKCGYTASCPTVTISRVHTPAYMVQWQDSYHTCRATFRPAHQVDLHPNLITIALG